MIHRDMSNESYHADISALSSSMLKTLDKSPAHFFDMYLSGAEKQAPSQSMIRGTTIHTMTLEPTWFDDRFVVIPDGLDRRTKEGKALWQEMIDSGKQPLTVTDYDMAKGAFKSVMSHPVSKIIFQTDGIAESSIYWEQDGVTCKARPDYMIPPRVSEQFPNGLLVDIKSSSDASTEAFSRNAYRLGYHISAAHYCNGFKAEYGTQPAFLFCVVETSRPYLSRYFAAGAEFMHHGKRKCEDLLELYQECVETGNWYGYSQKIETLELPAYIAKKLAFEEL